MRLPMLAALSLAAVAGVAVMGAFADDAPVFRVDPSIAGMSADQKVAAREAAMKEDGSLLRGAGRATGQDAIKIIDTVTQNFTNFPALFADGATNSKSEALPIIWQEFDKFTAIIDQGKAALGQMRTAAASGDSAGYQAGLKALGNTCFTCHQTYRMD